MIKNLIMDDASWLKLDIMSLFSRKTSGIYSINTLCSEMQLSYTTASTLVQEIDRELFDLFGGHFLRKDGKISWQPKRYRHNQYIQYLIRESIPYNFILYSLIEPELSFAVVSI